MTIFQHFITPLSEYGMHYYVRLEMDDMTLNSGYIYLGWVTF